jgi:hypothetical protein
MGVDYRHGISILQLLFYVPVAFFAFWVAFRHGFSRSAGWFFFVVFTIVRIVGACLSLALISHESTGLVTAWAIFTSAGLVPLILGLIGLLSRM